VTQTFSKRRRLRAHSEFRRVQSGGQRSSQGSVALLVGRSPLGADAEARLGMVVSRKVGTAVKRNSIKRWLREWFRTRGELLPHGVDLVVIAKRGAVERGHCALVSDVDSLVRRLARARP
jgi:ribonuclease P protein component